MNTNTEVIHQRYVHICSANNRPSHAGIINSLMKSANAKLVLIEASDTHGIFSDDDMLPVAILIKEFPERWFRIKLTDQKIACKGAGLLASLLQVHTRITSINLSGNLISDEGVAAFGVSFASCPFIPNFLDLSKNRISDRGCLLLCKGLSLRAEKIRNPEISMRQISRLTLKLDGNPLSEVSCSALADLCLIASDVIKTLSISVNNEELVQAAYEAGVELTDSGIPRRANMNEGYTGLIERVDALEKNSMHTQTIESRLKRMNTKIAETEKSIFDAQVRENSMNNKMAQLEETLAKEQQSCLRILKQCTKVVSRPATANMTS